MISYIRERSEYLTTLSNIEDNKLHPETYTLDASNTT